MDPVGDRDAALPCTPDGPGPGPHRRAHHRPGGDPDARRLDDDVPPGPHRPPGAAGGVGVRPDRPADRRRPGRVGLAAGLARLPAFVHIRVDGSLAGAAEGWAPDAWNDAVERLAKEMAWTRPLIPAPGDPAPFAGWGT